MRNQQFNTLYFYSNKLVCRPIPTLILHCHSLFDSDLVYYDFEGWMCHWCQCSGLSLSGIGEHEVVTRARIDVSQMHGKQNFKPLLFVSCS